MNLKSQFLLIIVIGWRRKREAEFVLGEFGQ